MIALYSPGHSLLHRMPALAKLAGLALAVTVVALLREPWQLAIALVATLLGFLASRVRWRLAGRAVLPVFWLLLIAVPLNGLFAGWEPALVMALRVVTVAALAALVALTTTVTAILEAITRLLRPFPRLDADRIGLLLALTIRAVPLLAEIVAAVLEARKARGMERSLRAVAVPVVVRALQTADGLGDALIARGIDD